MERIDVREVGEPVIVSPEKPSLVERLLEDERFCDGLYGVKKALLFGPEDSTTVAYLGKQENTHVQEGLDLEQCTPTEFSFDGNYVLDSFGEPVEQMIARGHRTQLEAEQKGTSPWWMSIRTKNDENAASEVNHRMKHAPVGSAWFRITPYAEEEPESEVRAAGMWPETRRSFIWLDRKKDDNTLETTFISVDNSQLTAYLSLLDNWGYELPEGVSTHDLTGYIFDLPDITSEEERQTVIHSFKKAYREASSTKEKVVDGLTSDEFLERYGQPSINLLVRLQQEIAFSFVEEKNTSFVSQAVKSVLTKNYLTDSQREDMQLLLHAPRLSVDHIETFDLLLKAHRVGVWHQLKELIKEVEEGAHSAVASAPSSNYIVGEQINLGEIHQLEDASENTQQAADSNQTMPGCPGGVGFLNQSEAQLKQAVLGKEGESKLKFMSCPHCSARVLADPCAEVLACWDCKATVMNGKVISKGNGGSKRRREEAEAKQRAQQEAKLKKQVEAAFQKQGVASFEAEQQKVAQSSGKVAVNAGIS